MARMNLQGGFEQLLSDALEGRIPFADALPDLARRPVLSVAEARAICQAANALARTPRSPTLPHDGLHYLTVFFQQVEAPDAFAVLQQHGIPLLCDEFDARLHDPEQDADDLLFMLKIFGLYRTSAGMDRILRAVRQGLQPESEFWALIFGTIDEHHPLCEKWMSALREPLPAGAIGLLYLDQCNEHAAKDERFAHPFDNPRGMALLQRWLALPGSKPALSVTNALPFISETRRLTLLPRAMEHPELIVQMVGASAAASAGIEAGVEFLAACCLNPNRSGVARKFLNALGREDVIPDQANEPGFQAMARMCEWLCHPQEYGRPPLEIELHDTRTIFWPPADKRVRVWLFKFQYSPSPTDKRPPAGVGMVGSVTAVLHGETNATMPAADVYALHCCWELERAGDARAPNKRSIDAGRRLLELTPG